MTTLLRIGLEMSSIASVVMAGWLVSVVLTVLPARDPASVPLWSGVAIATTALVVVSLLAIRRSGASPAGLTAAVAILAATAVGFGLFTLGTEMTAARNGDPEGYLFVIGVILAAQGALGLVWLASVVVRRPG
jgi:hypothetical protein